MNELGSIPRFFRALRHAWRMANPWTPMVRDARGRITPLYRIDRILPQAMGASALPEPVFQRVRARLLSRTRAGMGATPAVLLAAAAGYLAIFALAFGQFGQFGLSVLLISTPIVIGVVAFSVWSYRYRVPKARREAIVAALLAECRCASCAYDLDHSSIDGAGRRRCPECGACWRTGDPSPGP